MTTTDESSRPDPIPAHVPAHAHDDHVLSVLAQAAQEDGLGLSVTLNVAGAILTGIVVGRDEWFRLQTERARDASEAAGTIVGSIAEGMKMAFEEEADVEEGERKPTVYGFIHLREAAMVAGGRTFGPNHLWRVRIDHVSSWMLGSFEV